MNLAFIPDPGVTPMRAVTKVSLASFLIALLTLSVLAHPAGDMVYAGDVLLWSYVCPVDTSTHTACVMMWSEREGVNPWLISEYPASDWFHSLSSARELYLLERYHDPSRQKQHVRLLKSLSFQEPKVIWDWFDDTHRVGEGGFVMLSDSQMLFARHPHLYVVKQGQAPKQWRAWSQAVNRVRSAENGQLLVQSDEDIWLISRTGEVKRHWHELLEQVEDNLPFMGNRIFDAAYRAPNLWLAYWGQRRFDVIAERRRTVLELSQPFLPHAVAAGDDRTFFLASSLDPGHDIRPQLWMLDATGLRQIWGPSR